MMLEIIYGRALRFLNKLLPSDSEGILNVHFSPKKYLADIFSEDPVIMILHKLMSLKVYKNQKSHSNSFLAKLLNLSEEQVIQKLQTLEEAGLISRESDEDLYLAQLRPLDTGIKSAHASRKITNYYKEKILQKAMESPTPDDVNPTLTSAYLLYTTNPALEEKVFNLCRQFYIDLNNLVNSEALHIEPENIRYIGIDLFHPVKIQK